MGTWDKAGAYEYEEPDCGCATGPRGHKFAEHPDCEYHEHHCDGCHERRQCTKVECGMRR